LRFENRIGVYLGLLDDRYPSTDEGQSVTLEFPYPDAKQGLNRWLPLVKWFLAIPHYVVLFFLILAAIVCVIIAWFAILFTGRYPRGLFDFVVGVGRWSNRVILGDRPVPAVSAEPIATDGRVCSAPGQFVATMARDSSCAGSIAAASIRIAHSRRAVARRTSG